MLRLCSDPFILIVLMTRPVLQGLQVLDGQRPVVYSLYGDRFGQRCRRSQRILVKGLPGFTG